LRFPPIPKIFRSREAGDELVGEFLASLATCLPQHNCLSFDPAIASHRAKAARFMALGGEPMASPRHIWWNFVSSRKDRIAQAKADWKMARFDAVPGDTEFIPLPEPEA
jgi:hypothetical protein